LGQKDKELRDRFYNGLLGTHYQELMPFLSLPVRPARAYWKGWLAYAFVILGFVGIVVYLLNALLGQGPRWPTVADSIVLLLCLSLSYFFYKHPYLLHLIILAVPVRISILLNRFRSVESFAEVHAKVLRELLKRDERLQVLDIATGTCNSLYRHGWMKLNAQYTGLDLSETMLLQGLEFMAEKQVPMDFVLGDATRLPFEPDTFDVVLNYGAINGFTNPRLALEEMARVAKKGGLVLFLDEQLYPRASWIEKQYFNRVLSGHNVIHDCPVASLPPELTNVEVHQVYQFYYLCVATKA